MKKNLLPNTTIIQKHPMRLLPPLRRINSRPTPHLRRPREERAEDFKREQLETGPFAHHFGDDPARVGVVDYDFGLGGYADLGGDFLDGVHFEEFGEVVSVFFWNFRIGVLGYQMGFLGGEMFFVPVVHSGLFLVGEGGEDGIFLAFGELGHPVDEGCDEDEAGER